MGVEIQNTRMFCRESKQKIQCTAFCNPGCANASLDHFNEDILLFGQYTYFLICHV